MKASSRRALIVPVLAVAALIAGRETQASGPAASLTSDTGAAARGDPRSAIFVKRGCPECHAISALRVKARTDVGPDLTFAYVDVVNRYGLNLRSFLENPRGLMGFVLTSHVHLSATDQDSINRILRSVYQEHLADMDQEIPSSPPGRARPRGRSAPR
ncbi:MAG TPA: hypothetical protein VNA31_00960 [bacterium]|nr:hypothetical protein [bacterium]